MEKFKKHWHKVPGPLRKILIFIIGVAVLIAGVAMLALPGPGWATIFLGLAILATEFSFAHRLKQKIVKRFTAAAEAVKQRLKR